MGLKIVKYTELKPCFDAFIDTRTPGSDKKENFTIIGPGVSENPHQYVHIREPHGFNIGGARQPPGCVNSQHSHQTAEVFFVHSGTWAFRLGEQAKDAEVILQPGDLISIPVNLFRGFENIGQSMGFLWSVLGGDDPGHVLWAPYVFDMAKDYGLILLENGDLIDTTKGETIPDNMRPLPKTTSAQIEQLAVLNDKELRACCVMADEKIGAYEKDNIHYRPLIGANAKLNWPHDFAVSQIIIPPKQTHAQAFNISGGKGAEVIFIYQGELSIKTDSQHIIMQAGDTASVPMNIARQYANESSENVSFLCVQRNA